MSITSISKYTPNSVESPIDQAQYITSRRPPETEFRHIIIFHKYDYIQGGVASYEGRLAIKASEKSLLPPARQVSEWPP